MTELAALVCRECRSDGEGSLILRSRAHPCRDEAGPFHVKRDDELSFGVSGTKYRRFASLIPALLAGGVQRLVVCGGLRANFPLAAAQLFTEAGLEVHLVLRRPAAAAAGPGVNGALLPLLVPRPRLHLTDGPPDKDAALLQQRLEEEHGGPVPLLPEGGIHPGAMAGALSLLTDIRRNETVAGHPFEGIWMDAGTGFGAGAVLAGLRWSGLRRRLNVVLLAGAADGVLRHAARVEAWLVGQSGRPSLQPGLQADFHRPAQQRSFGAVGPAVRQAVHRMAALGILTDPVWSGKFFMTLAGRPPARGRVLAVHSGGALSLSGFPGMLEKGD